jgi:hypothetical protein
MPVPKKCPASGALALEFPFNLEPRSAPRRCSRLSVSIETIQWTWRDDSKRGRLRQPVGARFGTSILMVRGRWRAPDLAICSDAQPLGYFCVPHLRWLPKLDCLYRTTTRRRNAWRRSCGCTRTLRCKRYQKTLATSRHRAGAASPASDSLGEPAGHLNLLVRMIAPVRAQHCGFVPAPAIISCPYWNRSSSRSRCYPARVDEQE